MPSQSRASSKPARRKKTAASQPSNQTVFISYAWEDGEDGTFRNSVKAMRDWLLDKSIHVISDFDHAIRPPEKGWPIWMQHSIEDACVVLIVCSPKYKLRYEKRGPKDEGLGATWEGAVITQNLYDGAQRNDKFYPIFVDPVDFEHVPAALKAWCNGHSFPSKQDKILALIEQCLADASSAPSPRKAAGAKAKAKSTTQQQHNHPQPDPSPDDSARIQHTRERIKHYIGQQHFSDLIKLPFAADGLPQAVSIALQETAGKSKGQMAQECNDAILAFARNLLDCGIEAGEYASVSERKAYLYKALINAMQQSILLSARRLDQKEQQVLAAYQVSPPCELEVMSWLSVSVLMRDELAEHLEVELPQGQAALFKDRHQTEFHNEVELGTFVRGSEAGATALARQIAHRALYPAAAVFPLEPSEQQINELRGDLRIKKMVDKQPILTTINKTAGAPSARFIQWLNEELHVGVILINAKEGFFELDEGNWKGSLSALYKTLRPLQPASAGKP